MQICLILLLTFLAYSATIRFDFAYDDHIQILQNPRLTSWSFFGQYFTTHAMAQSRLSAANYYRPLFLTWLRLQFQLFGTNPAGWHFASLCLHLLATTGIFFVTRRLSGNQSVAAVTSLLFGVVPVHVETVAWISGSTDLLAGVFLIGSFLLYSRDYPRQPIWAGLLSGILFACALLVKEPVILFPFILLAWSIAKCFEGREVFQETLSGRWWTYFRWLPAQFLVAAAYFGVYLTVMSQYPRKFHHTLHGVWVVLQNQPKILWFYISHLIWPQKMSEFYEYTIERSLWNAAVLRSLLWLFLTVLAAGAVFYWMRKRNYVAKSTLVAALAWMFLPLLPALDLVLMPYRDYVHDRYLYIPSIGFCILAGAVFGGLLHRFSAWRNALSLIGVAVVLLLVWQTHSEAAIWKNDESLYRRAIEVYPANTTALGNLGSYLVDQGRIPEAIEILNHVLAYDPKDRSTHVNLALCYEATGDLQRAEEYWEKAQQIQPDPSIETNLNRVRAMRAAQDAGTSAPARK